MIELTPKLRSFELTPEEESAAMRLSPETSAFVNNLKTVASESLLELTFVGDKETQFEQMLEQAHFRGVIAACDALLAGTDSPM